MQRLLTAALGVPLALLAVFKLPAWGFFLVTATLLTGASWEFARLARALAPAAPWPALPLAVPPAAAALWLSLAGTLPASGLAPLLLGAIAAIGVGTLVLLARTPEKEALIAIGALSFALPYFAVPIAALVRIQQIDPWIFFLLLAIVWLGDSAAYYLGTRFGRHKLAPRVSPHKSWEGAIAGFATSVAATAVWSLWRLDRLALPLLLVGAATAVAAQLGDLVQSLLKRGAGVKDSGGLLPGHGGLWDRTDAMLFAAPAFLLLLRWSGHGGAPR
jgi:phosphatidate cytidylyltransferase